MKPKVLILLAHYTPGIKIGGPLTSIKNIISNLSEKFDFYVLTFDRDFQEQSQYPNIVTNHWIKLENSHVCYIKKNNRSLFRIFNSIRELNPDIIYANPILDPIFSISIVLASRLNLLRDIKIIVAPRGELYNEALNFKKRKKNLFLGIARICNLYKFIDWHATNEQEKLQIIEKLLIKPNRIKVARIIPNTILPLIDDTLELNETEHLLKIVFLARISKDKNLR